jgi:hypothetical protein
MSLLLHEGGIHAERILGHHGASSHASGRASVSVSSAMAGWRRSLARQRLRLGPILPIGIPSLACR